MWDTHIPMNCNSIHSVEEGNPTICDNMDGPWGHYAKWNKPDTEWQVLHGVTYMWNLKSQLVVKQNCCQCLSGGENGEMLVKGSKVYAVQGD